MVNGREQLPINIDDTECRDPQGIIILLLLQLGFEKLPAQTIRPSCHTQIHVILILFLRYNTPVFSGWRFKSQ